MLGSALVDGKRKRRNKVKITIKQQEVEHNSEDEGVFKMPTNHDKAKTLFTTDMEIERPRKGRAGNEADSNMFAQLITELHSKQMAK